MNLGGLHHVTAVTRNAAGVGTLFLEGSVGLSDCQGLRPVETLHINNEILSGMDCSRNPIVDVRVPMQLIQDALGRLGESGYSSQMHVWQQENCQ